MATGALTLTISDGTRKESLSTDTLCTRALATPGEHFVAFVVDAGPLIMRVLVDGVLCDGSGVSQRGWSWFTSVNGLGQIAGGDTMRIGGQGPGQQGGGGLIGEAGIDLSAVQLYTRALLTSELVGNARDALKSK